MGHTPLEPSGSRCTVITFGRRNHQQYEIRVIVVTFGLASCCRASEVPTATEMELLGSRSSHVSSLLDPHVRVVSLCFVLLSCLRVKSSLPKLVPQSCIRVRGSCQVGVQKVRGSYAVSGAMELIHELTDENIILILSWLVLTSLPSCAAISWRWYKSSVVGFSKQLQWRHQVHYREIVLPSKQLGEGFVTFLVDGSPLILAADHDMHRILTFLATDKSASVQVMQPKQQTSREWPYSRLRSGVAGLVGYAGQQIAFFPAAAKSKSTWSSKTQVIGRTHQNILHCGEHLFLLCHGSWWDDAQLFADVLDLQEGTCERIEITKLRDDMAHVLGDDDAQRQAVSSTRDHFVFHVNTFTGTKVAGAVRIPKAPATAEAACIQAPVSFAKVWPSGHPIAQLEQPGELPVEDHLLLYSPWQRRGLNICLLDAASGDVRSQLLRPPPATGAASRFFADRGVGALAVSLSFDVICACSVAPRGLQPPPVLVWDLSTGLLLREFCHDAVAQNVPVVLPAAPDEPNSSGYNFSVGDMVQCFTGDGWQQGQVTQQDYREADWPVGVTVPYQVRLTGEAPGLIYVPRDLPRLIRPAANWHTYASEEVDLQIAIHPARRCIMIGLWQKFRGRVHCLDVVP